VVDLTDFLLDTIEICELAFILKITWPGTAIAHGTGKSNDMVLDGRVCAPALLGRVVMPRAGELDMIGLVRAKRVTGRIHNSQLLTRDCDTQCLLRQNVVAAIGANRGISRTVWENRPYCFPGEAGPEPETRIATGRIDATPEEGIMRVKASESTAIKGTIQCPEGHVREVWYIRTPEGLLIEFEDHPHQYLPLDSSDAVYVQGDCCFKAACDYAWHTGLNKY
jgi:hypothetical protein